MKSETLYGISLTRSLINNILLEYRLKFQISRLSRFFFFRYSVHRYSVRNSNKMGCKLDGKEFNGRNIEAIMLAHVVN